MRLIQFQWGSSLALRPRWVWVWIGFFLQVLQVQGQFIPQRGSPYRATEVGRVGWSGVARNSSYLGTGSFGFGGGQVAPGNYAGADAGSGSFLGGRMGERTSFFGPGMGKGMFLSAPLASGFARQYATAPPAGTGFFTLLGGEPPLKPVARNAALLERIFLTNQLGNTAPARNPEGIGRIRDEMSQRSLDHAPAPERVLNDLGEHRPYSEMLAERLAAERHRAITEGWELFNRGDYGQAVRRFQTAEVADREDPAAAVGIICSAMANESSALANVVFARLLDRGRGVFGLEVNLRTKHVNPDYITAMVSQVGRAARQNPENIQMAAMSAFLLWFSGDHDEALRVADQIYAEHRTSPFAALAAQMRGETVPASQDNILDPDLRDSAPSASKSGGSGL
jgi:hypothetical protein